MMTPSKLKYNYGQQLAKDLGVTISAIDKKYADENGFIKPELRTVTKKDINLIPINVSELMEKGVTKLGSIKNEGNINWYKKK